jgi:hypothetical protein
VFHKQLPLRLKVLPHAFWWRCNDNSIADRHRHSASKGSMCRASSRADRVFKFCLCSSFRCVLYNSNKVTRYSSMKMEKTQCSETSAIKHHTPGNNPKDYTQQVTRVLVKHNSVI